MNDSQKIHNWLRAGCWHEYGDIETSVGSEYGCAKCGTLENPVIANANRDYSTWAGMELLLAGLEAKGLGVRMEIDGDEAKRAVVTDFEQADVEATADSLPAALCAATLKLIAAESNTTRQPSDHKTEGRNGEKDGLGTS